VPIPEVGDTTARPTVSLCDLLLLIRSVRNETPSFVLGIRPRTDNGLDPHISVVRDAQQNSACLERRQRIRFEHDFVKKTARKEAAAFY
jgi:hypothetical protein